MFIINAIKQQLKTSLQSRFLPRKTPKNLLTRAQSRYKVNLVTPTRAGCACAILRAPQPIPASNLSEGSEVDVPVRLSHRNRESRAHTLPSWNKGLLGEDDLVSQSATL
jgi:hypothetical protein